MFIDFRILMMTGMLCVGITLPTWADEPGLIAPAASPDAADASRPTDNHFPVPPRPAETGTMVPPSPPPAVGVPTAKADITPVSACEPAPPATTTRPIYVAQGVCPYCGDPNCRRSAEQANCCDRIRAGLYEHFGRGAPGYLYTPVPPAGSRLYAIMDWQISNGQAALQVLYDYDFLQNGAALSVRGERQLRKILLRAQRNHHPIIIESTPYQPELQRQRWEYVVQAISRLETPIVPERIIVAVPPGRQAEGEELPILYSGFLGQSNLGPSSVGVSGASGAAPPAANR